MISLGALLDGPVFAGYVYSYPHKTAYRQLEPPRQLRSVWSDERRESLFLYLHVPFCEYRCGFCNLFTRATPPEQMASDYLIQLQREAEAVRDELGDCSFGQLAIGGGTPTFLTDKELTQLLAIVTDTMGADPTAMPVGVECSPATATASSWPISAEPLVSRAWRRARASAGIVGTEMLSRKIKGAAPVPPPRPSRMM